MIPEIEPAADPAAILGALNFLFHPDDVLELRAIGKKRKVIVAGYFDGAHREQMAVEAVRLNRKSGGPSGWPGAAVYVTLNPIDPQLLSRCCNRTENTQGTATDNDVTGRRWLLLDFDPIRPANTSATQAQLDAAREVASACFFDLMLDGWPDPVQAGSGNGYHLLYPLDLPNDSESRDLVKGVLVALAARFDTDQVQLDQSVFNAGRITKLYGTVANKGDHTPLAPWRLSRLTDTPARGEVVTVEQLRALLQAPSSSYQPGNGRAGAFDLIDFLGRLGIDVEQDTHEGSERFKLAHCPFNPDHGKGEAAIFRRDSGALGFKCQHNSCADKSWADVRTLVDGPAERWTQHGGAEGFDDVPGDDVIESQSDRQERISKALAERDEKAAKVREEKRVARDESFQTLGLPLPTAAADLPMDPTERREVQVQEWEAARQALLASIECGGIPSVERAAAIKQTGLLSSNQEKRIASVAELAQNLVDLNADGDPFAPLPHCVDKWLPCDEVTLLAGHGGSGKSFVALNLAAHVALGLPFGDLATVQTPVLFFSCEDSARVLRQRLAKLCGALMLDMAELSGRLLLFDASDMDPALYRKATDGEGRVFTDTTLLRNLADMVKMLDAGFVVIDNASDAFDGEEIRRAEVRTFIRSLRQQLARPGRAVLLLAHVNRGTATAGGNPRANGNSEDYSGSTAWHNSVRSRLSLAPQGVHGLMIEHAKANLGEKAAPIEMVWHEGAPVVSGFLSTPPAAVERAQAAEKARDEVDKAALVSIVQDFDKRGESVTSSMSGSATVFKLLKGAPGFPKGANAERTNHLLRELETEGRIFRRKIRKDYKDREIFTSGAPVESPPIRPTNTVCEAVSGVGPTGAIADSRQSPA